MPTDASGMERAEPQRPMAVRSEPDNVIPFRRPMAAKPEGNLVRMGRRAAIGSILTLAGGFVVDSLWNRTQVTEDQTEKMAKFKPNRLFVGTLKFKPGSSDIHTEPNFQSHDYSANRIDGRAILGMGEKPVSTDDQVELVNPLALDKDYPDPRGPTGAQTIWFQVPDVTSRFFIVKKRVTGYTPLSSATANGSFYDITSEDAEKYYLKGHDPVRKNQTQIYNVNGK